jgi:hypothetical protein
MAISASSPARRDPGAGARGIFIGGAFSCIGHAIPPGRRVAGFHASSLAQCSAIGVGVAAYLVCVALLKSVAIVR